MDFSDFLEELRGLPAEQYNIILKLMTYFKHEGENRKDLMALALSVIIRKKGMSKNEIANKIEENYGLYYYGIRDTIISAINRFSNKSRYIKDILNIVDVDIKDIEYTSFYLRESYLHNLWVKKYKKDYADEVEWLWDTLSDENKKVVYFLAFDLNYIYSPELREYFSHDYLNSDYIFKMSDYWNLKNEVKTIFRLI